MSTPPPARTTKICVVRLTNQSIKAIACVFMMALASAVAWCVSFSPNRLGVAAQFLDSSLVFEAGDVARSCFVSRHAVFEVMSSVTMSSSALRVTLMPCDEFVFSVLCNVKQRGSMRRDVMRLFFQRNLQGGRGRCYGEPIGGIVLGMTETL